MINSLVIADSLDTNPKQRILKFDILKVDKGRRVLDPRNGQNVAI